MSNVTKNFDLDEFACPCCMLNYTFDEAQRIALHLEAIRYDLNVPITISSGRRCQKHNIEVGGVSGSQHCYGLAVDIYADDVCPTVLAMVAYKAGFRSIGIGSDYIHLDMRNFGGSADCSSIWHY